MISVEVKKIFFDSEDVQEMVDKSAHQVLPKFGAFVRSTARQSIKHDKKPSKPGQPPHTRTGLIKKIISVYDRTHKSVIVGPARLNKPTQSALPALEYGGQSVAWAGRGRKRLKRIVIQRRPFMQPALEKELHKLPDLWANSVKQ